jgi:hypothetical protein
MKFERPVGEMYEVSDCGRYTVSFAYVLGVPTYQGWRRPLLADKPAILLTPRRVISKATARGHCIADAESIAATQPIPEESVCL